MVFAKNFIVWSMGFFFLNTLTYAGKSSDEALRSFWHPMYLNKRLSYCTLQTNECGKKVADTYCRMMGYQTATKEVIAYNLKTTQFIDTRATCEGKQCNGFMLINCALSLSHNPPKPYYYSKKLFVYPRINNYRIDWCYQRNKSCGAPVAHAFCRQLGYMKAEAFKKETQTGVTKTLGSQELCSGSQCNGFQSIVCSR